VTWAVRLGVCACALLATLADGDQALVEQKSTRVMGVGVGVFLVGFFGALSILICCFGSVTERPW
jgi:hypothetical protein